MGYPEDLFGISIMHNNSVNEFNYEIGGGGAAGSEFGSRRVVGRVGLYAASFHGSVPEAESAVVVDHALVASSENDIVVVVAVVVDVVCVVVVDLQYALQSAALLFRIGDGVGVGIDDVESAGQESQRYHHSCKDFFQIQNSNDLIELIFD